MTRIILSAFVIGSLLAGCMPAPFKPLYEADAKKIKTIDIVIISKNTPVFVEQVVKRSTVVSGDLLTMLVGNLVLAGIDAAVNAGNQKMADQIRIDLAPLTSQLSNFDLLKEHENIFSKNTTKEHNHLIVNSIKSVNYTVGVYDSRWSFDEQLAQIKKNSTADSILFIRTQQKFVGANTLPYSYIVQYSLIDKKNQELSWDNIEIIAPKIIGNTVAEKADDLVKNDKFKNFLLHSINLTAYTINDALLNKTEFISEEKHKADTTQEDKYLETPAGKKEISEKQKTIQLQRNCSSLPPYTGYDPKIYNSLRVRMQDSLTLYVNCELEKVDTQANQKTPLSEKNDVPSAQTEPQAETKTSP